MTLMTKVDDHAGGRAQHFKSRERIQGQGEVFTQQREIDAMLDLIPDAFESLDTSFLEPAAGNGNFLVQIFRRKVGLISEEEFGGTDRWLEFASLRALSSIYAVDIDPENVEQARRRMLREIQTITVDRDCWRAANVILSTNIVVGDTLNHPESICFVRYEPLEGEQFRRTIEFLRQPEVDLFFQPPETLEDVHFKDLDK